MNQLPGFDAIATVEPSPQTKKPKTEYYLRAMSGGSWWFLWCTHTNGGGEWMPETDLTINGGRKKPLRYKTYSGAKRMLPSYVNEDVRSEVVVWHE